MVVQRLFARAMEELPSIVNVLLAREPSPPAARCRRGRSSGAAFMTVPGRRLWAIAEGYIPPSSTGETRELTSHETVCILNAGKTPAHVEIMIYFADREPAGPYRFTVDAERTRHLRFNDFSDPAPVPVGTDFSSVISSDVPIVVQHTRLDSRQAALALLSTMAFASD
jgi:hypothetical protein